jgi:glycosyltransferase involved in cell wall biosynthesis
MKIGMLCCWRNMRIYPVYSAALRRGLEALTGARVPVLTTDCFCWDVNDPVDRDYEYIDLRYIPNRPGTSRLKNSVKNHLYPVMERRRGHLFASRADEFDVVDFQQSSYAFGYESLKSFLETETRAKKFVTIHKFDAIQKEKPEVNIVYNKADGVIVFSDYMKQVLVKDGVDPEKVAVIHHGTELPAPAEVSKTQAIMFCGSPIPTVKGFEDLVVVLRLLRDQGIEVPLKIYGFRVPDEEQYAMDLARAEGVDHLLTWQGFRNMEELAEEHEKSSVCLIPYTGYAGYFPAATAMGYGIPVVATDVLGHREYVDGSGILVPPHAPAEMAAAVKALLTNDGLRAELGAAGRRRAEEELGWDAVAARTLEIFQRAMDGKAVNEAA